MEFKNKNDYSVKLYRNGEQVAYMHYVQKVTSALYYFNTKGYVYDYILVIVRRSRRMLCYYKNGDFVHAAPTDRGRGRVKNGW